MEVKGLGERGIISMIHRMQPTPPLGFMGIGDDAAVLPAGPHAWLVSQDMLVEDIHFRWDWSTPEQLGYKAAQVNLSDIAAMGGTPRAALTSLAVPGRFSSEGIESLYRGLTRAFDPYGVVIVGGDTVGSVDRLVLDVTIIGQPAAAGPIRRTGARPGDRILVSGRLGRSYAGYMLLSHGDHWPGNDVNERSVLTAHLEPMARVALGTAVAPWVHALTDVSDGLRSELEELTRFGSIGAEVWLDKIPVDAATQAIAARFKSNSQDFALLGGEDYELLMTVPPSHVSDVMNAAKAVGSLLTEIGVISDRTGTHWMMDGAEVDISRKEPLFDHFAH